MSKFWNAIAEDRPRTMVRESWPQKLQRLARTGWRRLSLLRRRAPHQLRLCESLALGERRFVAVIEFEHSRFLVGGTSASLALLARLDPPLAEAAAWPESWAARAREPRGEPPC